MVKRFSSTLLVLFFCLHAVAAKKCTELLAINGDVHPLIYEGNKLYRPIDAFLEARGEASPIADIIKKKNPKIRLAPLRDILHFAIENAMQHGIIEGASAVEITVRKTPQGILIHILNDANHPLPESLRDKTFSSKTDAIDVPEKERDGTRGRHGIGVPAMLEQLHHLYREEVGKVPTLSFKEIQSPISGKHKILFELKLP